MMTDDPFANRATWSGSFYELEIRIGPRCDDRLRAVMRAIWSLLEIEGCYLHNHLARNGQPRLSPDEIDLLAEDHIYGVATMPNGKQFTCGTIPLQNEDAADDVIFYLPTGGLELVFPEVGGYPEGNPPPSRSWREPLDAWLAELAKSIYKAANFAGAFIGHETCGVESAEVSSAIPERRKWGLLLPRDRELVYFPTNDWDF